MLYMTIKQLFFIEKEGPPSPRQGIVCILSVEKVSGYATPPRIHVEGWRLSCNLHSHVRVVPTPPRWVQTHVGALRALVRLLCLDAFKSDLQVRALVKLKRVALNFCRPQRNGGGCNCHDDAEVFCDMPSPRSERVTHRCEHVAHCKRRQGVQVYRGGGDGLS